MEMSIIMPVYNAGDYIVTAVESILAQKYKEWELLIVDCNSEDESLEICKEYEREYENIHIIEIEQSSPGKARNAALEVAKGEYIVFVDADDYLPNEKIFSKFLKIAKSLPCDIVVCNYERLWKKKILQAESHRAFSTLNPDSEDFRFKSFFSVGNLAYVWAKMYRASFLRENNITFSDFPYAEDKLFNLQCYVCGARYAFLDDIGYVYRKNENSISHKYNDKMANCWLDIAKEFEKWLKEQQKEREEYYRLVVYIIFFGAFFSSKMEYEQHKKSIRVVRNLLKKYEQDELAQKSFEYMVKKQKENRLSQIFYRIMLRGFAFGMKHRLFLLLSIGVKIIVDQRIDEKLSDTGLRE